MAKSIGFANVADNIGGKEDVSKGEASAMLAASSRNASKKAKKKNPNLKKVKGKGNPFSDAAKVGK